MSVDDKKGWEEHTEKTRKRKKGRVIGRKEKKKSSHSKSPNTQNKKQLFSPFSSFLFDFSLFFSFSRFKNNKAPKNTKSTKMTDKKDLWAPSAKRLRTLVGQGDMGAKRVLARRLMEGNGVPQNCPKAVALLEDCVAIGDAEAMLMLAKYCALGHGMEHNAERAKSLIFEAANKGNHEALCLMRLINDWKGKHKIYPVGLSSSHWKLISSTTHLFFFFQCSAQQGEMHD